MPLPTSRNFTYDANAPVRSFDLNQLQDMAVALNSRPKIETFETNGTYTKPSWATFVYAIAVGRGGSAGTNFSGTVIGGAGGSGFIAEGHWPAALLSPTIGIQVARHDTADIESLFGTVPPPTDRRLLRARSGAFGQNASAGLGGHGGDGWAGGGGGRGSGGTGGTGGRGYGGRDGGIHDPNLSTGTGGSTRQDGGNGNTSVNGLGGTRIGPGGSAAGTYAAGGESPLVVGDIVGLTSGQFYGRGGWGSGAGLPSTPGNGVVIVVTFGTVNLASIPY